jgi:hypothetical protein
VVPAQGGFGRVPPGRPDKPTKEDKMSYESKEKISNCQPPASRQSKPSQIVESISFLSERVQALEYLIDELNGNVQVKGVPDENKKEPTNAVGVYNSLPDVLRYTGERIGKLTSTLREFFI